MQISQKKNVKRVQRSFYKVKKELKVLFSIYIYIYISVYIYIYILKKRTQRSAFFCKRTKSSRILLHSLQKNETFSAFFYVLYKRTLRSLRSFTFLRKERSVLLGLISRQKLEKRTLKNDAFFKRTEKNDALRTEKNAVPNPGFCKFFT